MENQNNGQKLVLSDAFIACPKFGNEQPCLSGN